MRPLRWIVFNARWWRWFLSFHIPLEIYTSRARIDKQSRDIILDRREREWLEREPKWSDHR